MDGRDARALQLGSDGSKVASTNGTFRVLDGNEKGEVAQRWRRRAPVCCRLRSGRLLLWHTVAAVVLGSMALVAGVEPLHLLVACAVQSACHTHCMCRTPIQCSVCL